MDKTKLNETVMATLPVPAKGSKIHNFAGAMIQGSTAPRGFGVRVTKAGVRTFVLRYWLAGVEHLSRCDRGNCGCWPAPSHAGGCRREGPAADTRISRAGGKTGARVSAGQSRLHDRPRIFGNPDIFCRCGYSGGYGWSSSK
jgi:hypothetical protein